VRAIRTEFVGDIDVAPLPEAFKGTVANFAQQPLQNNHESQPKHPERTADSIQEVLQLTLDGEGKTLLHMPHGAESLPNLRARAEQFLRIVKEREEFGLTMRFPKSMLSQIIQCLLGRTDHVAYLG
jgi:hypothetical protein